MPDASEALTDEILAQNFAEAMTAKLALAREKGRGGWYDPARVSITDLYDMLHRQTGKENLDLVDVGNLAAMIWQRLQSFPDERAVLATHIHRVRHAPKIIVQDRRDGGGAWAIDPAYFSHAQRDDRNGRVWIYLRGREKPLFFGNQGMEFCDGDGLDGLALLRKIEAARRGE